MEKLKKARAARRAKSIQELHDLFDEVDIEKMGWLVLEGMRIVLSQKGYTDHFIDVSCF